MLNGEQSCCSLRDLVDPHGSMLRSEVPIQPTVAELEVQKSLSFFLHSLPC